jgi:hypothetical protein
LYSTPDCLRSRFAAPMTFRPSPDPVITKSWGVTGQIQHSLDDSGGVGTHTPCGLSLAGRIPLTREPPWNG